MLRAKKSSRVDMDNGRSNIRVDIRKVAGKLLMSY